MNRRNINGEHSEEKSNGKVGIKNGDIVDYPVICLPNEVDMVCENIFHHPKSSEEKPDQSKDPHSSQNDVTLNFNENQGHKVSEQIELKIFSHDESNCFYCIEQSKSIDSFGLGFLGDYTKLLYIQRREEILEEIHLLQLFNANETKISLAK